jgi:hypothetical protein
MADSDRRVRRSVYWTASFSVCSLRRTELPIIYADFRLGNKLATLYSWEYYAVGESYEHCLSEFLLPPTPVFLGAARSRVRSNTDNCRMAQHWIGRPLGEVND